MKPFEFVLVIISVIVGLVLTEFAIGVSYMVQHYRTATYYWPHNAFLVLGFIACLNYWAALYRLRTVPSWSVPQFGIIVITGLFFSILSQIITPDQDNFDYDYKRYFHENADVLYALLICLVISLVLETYLLKIKARNREWFITMSINISLALSGLIFANETYQGLVAIILLCGQIYTMYSNRIIVKED